MLNRLKELADLRLSFAFETTLASRNFAPWITELSKSGYAFHLVFLWLPSAEHAILRVKERVQLGGHNIPEETIRRRYQRGLSNFFTLYQPIATSWHMYDNSPEAGPKIIATGIGTSANYIADAQKWDIILRYQNDTKR